MSKIGHNVDKLKEQIQEMAVDYAKCDEESQKLNDKRAEIRERAAELGLDTKAWQNEINRAKQSLKKKDGYDESASIIREALGDMDMEDLFEHVLRKEKEKEEAKKKKAEERKKEKAADDKFKAAPDRKPGPVKSVGEQQAEAIAKAPPVDAKKAAAGDKS